METVTIDEIEYVSTELLKTKATEFFKGSRNGRELVTKKDIDDDSYIYARYDPQKKEWIESEGNSARLDKVFLTLEYVEGNADLWNELNTEDVTKDAPNVIKLKKSEMFKDNEGNIKDIEARGVREWDGIYFRARDVRDELNVANLFNTILKETSTYEENDDYVYFYLFEDEKKIESKKVKRMFLTYKGINKYFSTTRNKKISDETKAMVLDWTRYLIGEGVLKEFIIHIPNNTVNYTQGYVYCITSFLVQCIKIGFWSGSIESLKSRYMLPYGNNLLMHCIKTDNARELENKTHKQFAEYCISNELFEKEYLDEYIDFILSNAKNEYSEKEYVIINPNVEPIILVIQSLFRQIDVTIKKTFYKIEKMNRADNANASAKLERELKEEKYKNNTLQSEIELIEKDNEIALLKKEMELQQEKHKNELLKRDMEIQKLNHENEKLKASINTLQKKVTKLSK